MIERRTMLKGATAALTTSLLRGESKARTTASPPGTSELVRWAQAIWAMR